MFKTILLLVLLQRLDAAPVRDDDAIAFPDSKSDNEIITPPVLPVIPHLENDPTTLGRDKTTRVLKDPSPRFGFNKGFDVTPEANGGFTASFSHGFSGLGHSQSGSHSFSLGGQGNGFQVSQSSSQSSSFGGGPAILGSSLSGSQSNSQSSSFTGGLNGISSSSSGSSANSLSGNLFGQGFSSSGSQSQSSAASAGLNGVSSAFGQGSGHAVSLPNGQTIANGHGSAASFGEGAIGAGSGAGFAQNGATASNSQSLASVQGGPSGFPGSFSGSGAGAGSGFAQGGGRGPSGFGAINDRQLFNGGDPRGPVRFPGSQSNRYPKVNNFRPFSPWQLLQSNRQIRRKPSQYQIIRIEV